MADDGLFDLLRQDRTLDELMGFAVLGEEFEGVKVTDLRFQCSCGPGSSAFGGRDPGRG